MNSQPDSAQGQSCGTEAYNWLWYLRDCALEGVCARCGTPFKSERKESSSAYCGDECFKLDVEEAKSGGEPASMARMRKANPHALSQVKA